MRGKNDLEKAVDRVDREKLVRERLSQAMIKLHAVTEQMDRLQREKYALMDELWYIADSHKSLCDVCAYGGDVAGCCGDCRECSNDECPCYYCENDDMWEWRGDADDDLGARAWEEGGVESEQF